MINKKLIIIMVVLILLIVVVGIGGYFILNKKDTVVPGDSISNTDIVPGGQLLPTTGSDEQTQPNVQQKQSLTQGEKDELEVGKLASFFVSMLGSYSTDANFSNIIDLKPMMTNKMQAWADDFIKRNLDSNNNKDEAITTKALSNEVLSNNAGQIVVLVKTRREDESQQDKKIYNQDALVTINKVGNNWLVDAVEWK